MNLSTCNAKNGARCYEGLAGSLSSAPRILYGRVARNETGAHRDIAYVLQYWLFYYFDDWRNSQLDPTIWQLHEGDWEVVSIGINRSGKPIYAGYSQHCGGRFRFWTDLSHDGDHAKVYVALGSHANFFKPGTYPAPLKCIPPRDRPVVAKFKLTDVAGENDPLGPGNNGASTYLIDDATPWLSFEGTWGEEQQIIWLDDRGKSHRISLGTSPVGPAQQTNLLWSNPVEQTEFQWPQENR